METTLPVITSAPLSVICSTPSEAVEALDASYPESKDDADGVMESSEVLTMY